MQLSDVPTVAEWLAANEAQRRLWRAKRWLIGARLADGYPTGLCTYDELVNGPQAPVGKQTPVFSGSNVVSFGEEPIKRKAGAKKTTISTRKRKAA